MPLKHFCAYHRSLERGQILGKDMLSTIITQELIYDFVKYDVKVAQAGPNSFVAMVNGSAVDVDLQVMHALHVVVTGQQTTAHRFVSCKTADERRRIIGAV